MAEEKSTLIMVEVLPAKNGKREVIVSAAPTGEMPVARKGTFADVHNLINQVWGELLRRKPQVPRNTLTAKAEPEPAAPAAQDKPAGDAPGVPAELPKIEGDQMVASTEPAAAPPLSSLEASNEVTEEVGNG